MGDCCGIGCGSSKLEKKINGTQERMINKISNFAIASIFTVAGTIAGGKMAWYGIQQNNYDKSYSLGIVLLSGGLAATGYCFNKIGKGVKALKSFY
ncbi:MAG: hypothetical protein V1660_00190 [archaeon]